MRIKNKKPLILLLVVIACFIYLNSNSTYTSYESEVSTSAEGQVADWRIKVNNTLVTGTENQVIDIDTVDWESNHTAPGTASPGTKGTIEITIDPTTTQVAFNYELTIIDNTVNPDKLLTVENVESSLGNLQQEGNIYKGTMTLNDIKAGKKDIITIHALWDDEGQDIMVDPNNQEESVDMIEIDFKASQRK